jgi:hypothetical protein
MITIVRARFDTNNDAGSVWSDELFQNWMQPLRPYSLGNFWWSSSHALYPLDYALYPPIVISDPRPQAPPGNDAQRGALVDAAIAKATSQVKPDWDNTDILLLWFAQKTDYFSGGTANVPLRNGGSKQVVVTVVDTETPFDAVCEELGHSFGLKHELDAAGNEYGSPYSAMSARAESGRFVRKFDQGLPDGKNVTDLTEPFIGNASQRIIGPAVAAAQLYREPEFRKSPSVIQLSRDYARQPATLRLYALNYQLTDPPGPLPVLASFPSNAGDGRIFLVELRRGGFGYDAKIGTGSNSPAGLVVHSINPDGRIRYDGVAPLDLAAKYVEWPSRAGDFNLRLLYVDPHHEFVDFAVRGGARKYFPIRGVLLAGKFRTQHQLNGMSHEDMRNTLIVELTNRTSQKNFQAFDNDTLAGMGAVLVFLRGAKIRDDASLAAMTTDDQRNILIVELAAQTGVGQDLQAFGNMDLVLIALGSDLATRGQAPGAVSSFIRGDLLAGRFRTQHELNLMSHEDQRNTLIVELTNHSNQTNYQSYNDAELEGMGAVMVTLRELKIRNDAALKKMSADDQRNTFIVELDAQTHLGQKLQGFSNLELVLTALGVERG